MPWPPRRPPQPDSTDHVVKRVLANGTLITIAGISASSGYSGEGLPARSSLIANPQAVALLESRNGYLISCRATNRIMLLADGVGAALGLAAPPRVTVFLHSVGQDLPRPRVPVVGDGTMEQFGRLIT